MLEERGRHELRLAEGAGPGRLHRGTRRQPALDHDERGEHLLTEHLFAGGEKRLGAEHLEGIVGNLGVAEAGFAAPYRQDNAPRHAVAPFQRGQRGSMLPGACPAPSRHPGNRVLGKVVAGRTELGLVLVLRRVFLFTRHDEVGQLQVWLHTGKGRLECLFGDAAGLGGGPQVLGEPGAELVVDLRGRG